MGSNRLLSLLLCLLLIGMLASCGGRSPAPPIQTPPSESASPEQSGPEEPGGLRPDRPDFDALMRSAAAERIDDPAFLTEMWEEYLLFTYLNLSNGYVGFDSVEDLSPVNLCEYLYIQMERAGDTAGVVNLNRRYDTDERGIYLFGIPREKLETYCERYFGRTVDFSDPQYSQDPTVFYYDRQASLCRFYPGATYSHFRDNPLAYDRIGEWPGFALNFVDRFEGDIYVADTSCETVATLNNELLTKKFVMVRREDGSFYFDSCHLVWPETHTISISGSYTALPYPKKLMAWQNVVGGGEEEGIFIAQTGPRSYSLWDVLRDSELNAFTLPEGADAWSSVVQGRGDRGVVMTGTHWGQFDLALRERRPSAPLPGTLTGAVVTDGALTDLSFDFSDDMTMLAFVDDEGVKLYHLETGEVTLLPGTAPTRSEDIMRNEGFKTAEFVLDSRFLWCRKVGYESLNGYLLYNIETGESGVFDYRGGYGSNIMLTNRGAYLMGHYKGDRMLEPFYLDFETGKATAMPSLQNNDAPWINGVHTRYSAWLEFVGRTAEQTGREEVVVQNNATSEIHHTGCFVVGPYAPSPSTRILGVTDRGSVLVTATYLGEQYALLTAPIE